MLLLQTPPITLQDLTKIIAAIGGLGTAAFGLLDAIKSVIPWINDIGFGRIKKTVQSLVPGKPEERIIPKRECF